MGLPAAAWVNVTYNGGGLETFGLVVSQGDFYFDAYALVTAGLIYDTGSVWVDDDDCYAAIWTLF